MAKKLNESLLMERKESGKCVREFEFTLPADALKSESDRVSGYIAGMVQMPGFRVGRAPVGLVRSKYVKEIEEELRNRCVAAAVEKIEADKSLDILTFNFKTAPEIKDGADLKFSFEVNVMPEISLGDCKNIKLDIPLDAVSEDELAKRVDMYRSMWGGYADSDAPAKAEDMLKVNYKSDFVLPEDASATLKRQAEATDSFIWLSEPESIPGCIKALTGAEKGKEYKFTAEYPADYREAALAGKSVAYTVTVLAVQSRKKLDDAELIEKVKAASMEEFKDTLRKAMERENEGKRLETAQDAFYKRLDDAAGEFELPPALLNNEIQKEIQKIARETVKSDADAEKFKAEMDSHKAAAEKSASAAVRRTLILRTLAKLNNVTVADEELNGQLESMSRYYGYQAKELRKVMEQNGAMDELRVDMVNAKALTQAAEQALQK